MSSRSGFVISAVAFVALALVGCPSSEDDPPFCNDQKCGPGVCQQFCGNDAAKEGAADAPPDGTADAGETGTDAEVDATDGAADAPGEGG
jgi:hypothetical protein